MARIVQICPVGFEYHRVLEGLRIHPSNVIYLLRSFKKEVRKDDPDKKLISIANGYVKKLYDHFKQSDTYTEIIVRDTNITSYSKAIEELCLIIKREFEIGKTERIYINISTSNKLFVSAAMYVGSFFSEKIQLFYLRSSRYTINHLLDESYEKDEIKKLFIDYGMTYKQEGEEYKNVDIPLYPIQLISKENQVILKTLKAMTTTDDTWISLMNLLRKISAKALQ